MYEIWLVLNIVYEMALGMWPALLILLLIWLVLLMLNRKGLWVVPFGYLLTIAAGVAVVTGLAVPALTVSSFGNFGYWVDWANWLALSAGVGVTVAVWLWPLMARRYR
ncbi:MAG: hypothetical protein FJY36_02400 [Betaproteobacteria bacterium]|nr:hypothetical protein [Betaproteobacteria bacterium]